jgi:hypothetical protein
MAEQGRIAPDLYKRMIDLGEKVIQALSKRAEAEYTAERTLDEPCKYQ